MVRGQTDVVQMIHPVIWVKEIATRTAIVNPVSDVEPTTVRGVATLTVVNQVSH